MDSAKMIMAIILCLSFQFGYAQDSIAIYSESEVKAAVEEIGVLNICPDQSLLKLVELDVENCRSRLAKLATVCWHIIDPVVRNYEIEKDEDSKESAKSRIITLSLVYSSCIRSELVRGIGRKRRESDSG